MLENILLGVITLGALIYIYKTLIKKGCDGECNCGKK